MSETETTGPVKGALVYPDSAINNIVTRGVKAAQNIAVGDPVTFDTGGFAQKASDTVGNRSLGLGVALTKFDNTSGADGDGTIQIAMPDTWVVFTMGGVVQPFGLVKLNATFKAITHANPANATTPTAAEVNAARDYYGLTFGRYYGKYADGYKIPTASADTEKGILMLGAGV